MPFNRNVKKRVTYLLGNGHPPLKITVTVSPQIILCLFGRNQTVFWKDKEKKIRECRTSRRKRLLLALLLPVLSGTKTPFERLRVTKIINKANDTRTRGVPLGLLVITRRPSFPFDTANNSTLFLYLNLH